MVRIAVGCDHQGLALKQEVMSLLSELGYEYEDFGCYDSGAVDYPDIAQAVARAVAETQFQHGVLICGTGQGMSMTANKIPGIRAAVCQDVFSARRCREHNDANVLCLGGWVVGKGLAAEIVRTYLSAEFVGGRHARRVEKIRELEGATPSPTALSPTLQTGPAEKSERGHTAS